MAIAMLIIGLILGGCITTILLCCFQINRVNYYEQTIKSLKEKLNKEKKLSAVSIVSEQTVDTAFFYCSETVVPPCVKAR